MKKIHLDFETRSAADIKAVGAWGYARHPTTEAMCLGFAYDNEPVKILTAKDLKFGAHLNFLDCQIVSHNAHFEYAIYNYVLHQRYGWPPLWDPKQWSCTLARAAAANLPISLEQCALALKLPFQKDMTGRGAMMKLCRPIDYDVLDGSPIYREDQDLYEALYRYCPLDVEIERALDLRLPELPPSERKIWALDLIANARGFTIDLDLAQAGSKIAGELTDDLNAHLIGLTGGAVQKASRVAEMKRYFESQGFPGITSLDKTAVTGLLARPDVSPRLKEVLMVRRQVGKSSTAKYETALAAADPVDHRVRGGLQYHAAGTGRWGGRLLQPQNFPKGLPAKDQSAAIRVIKSQNPGLFSFLYGDKAMDTLSGVLRGLIVAEPGKELFVADFNAIEARVLFWEADDQRALNIYRRGDSPYVDMAQFIYSNPAITKKSHPQEYDLGKRAILGCGYGMGAEKFKATCWIQAEIDVPFGLADRAVKAYREKYRSVVSMWYATEAAALAAVKKPDWVVEAMGNKIRWGMDPKKEFLCCQLPSGRYLRYYQPSVKMVLTPWGEEKEELHYWCAGLTGALEEFKTYGGSLVENVTQAIARDLIAHGLQNLEAAGYAVLLSIHDEALAEREKGAGKLDEFVKLLCDTPTWARGCPVTAEGWQGERYRK